MPLRVYPRGKKWEYRIRDSKGKHVSSKGGFLNQKEATVAGNKLNLIF